MEPRIGGNGGIKRVRARHAIDMPLRRWLRFGGKKDPLLPRSLEWAMKNENTSMTQPFM